MVLSWGLVSCSDVPETNYSPPPKTVEKFSEVSPPQVIQQLSTSLEQYQPQVEILSPKTDELLELTSVAVTLQVQDLPVFKNEELGLGPHLHLILDNQPYRAVYDPQKPIVFDDLEPGTHTLRVFASRPWHESFKNEGAFAQTTFHVFTKTEDNNPDPRQPLLTYSRPNGSYGAEPIMLDFYLTNTPIPTVVPDEPDRETNDWQILVTANGQSFLLNSWQPIYLEGFESGANWISLELVDGQGNLIDNNFNKTVRAITYEPGGKDTLSKIVRGELTLEEVQGIVDPNYVFEPNSSPSEEELLTSESDTSQTELLPIEEPENESEPAIIEGTTSESLDSTKPIAKPEEAQVEEPIIEPVEAIIEQSQIEETVSELNPIPETELLPIEEQQSQSLSLAENLTQTEEIEIEVDKTEVLTVE